MRHEMIRKSQRTYQHQRRSSWQYHQLSQQPSWFVTCFHVVNVTKCILLLPINGADISVCGVVFPIKHHLNSINILCIKVTMDMQKGQAHHFFLGMDVCFLVQLNTACMGKKLVVQVKKRKTLMNPKKVHLSLSFSLFIPVFLFRSCSISCIHEPANRISPE